MYIENEQNEWKKKADYYVYREKNGVGKHYDDYFLYREKKGVRKKTLISMYIGRSRE